MRLWASCSRSGGILSKPTCLWIIVATLTTALLSPRSAAALETRGKGPIGKGVDIRILPIGDSITYGAGKPFCRLGAPAKHCNGYRKPLYESLIERGNKVEFVGGTSAGDFEQPRCEGHRGQRIDEITENSLTGIYAAPNIVLLHAGTNDAKDQKADYPQAHDHLRDLISLVYKASPDALVLLCTVIPADPAVYKGTASRIKDFNSKIPDVVDYFKSRDKKIRLVDMNQELTIDELSDGLHPNKEGYDIMAATFLKAIEDAEDDISKPTEGSEPPDSTSSSRSRMMPFELFKAHSRTHKGPKVMLRFLAFIVLRELMG